MLLMSKPRFKLLLPKPNEYGYLLWSDPKDAQEMQEYLALHEKIVSTGIWCTKFPEGDGFLFGADAAGKIEPALLTKEYYRRTVALFKEVFGDDLQYEEHLLSS
jgi:hypothetical protein